MWDFFQIKKSVLSRSAEKSPIRFTVMNHHGQDGQSEYGHVETTL